MTDDLLQTLIADCIDREDDVPYMYRDASKSGYVTCGIGKKLNSAMEACRLLLPDGTSAFRMGDRPATVVEISADFVRVLGLPPAHVSTYYRSARSPMLTYDFARDLCKRELISDYLPGISRIAGNVDTLPPSVVRALLTIDYTCGVGGLAGFHHMLASVARRDWQGIADREEYHLKPPATERTNGKLRDWFAEAAGAAG